jgi:hypothetical protein
LNRSKDDGHTRLENTSFNSANRDSTNASNLVNILKRETKRLVGGTCRRSDQVKGFNQ